MSLTVVFKKSNGVSIYAEDLYKTGKLNEDHVRYIHFRYPLFFCIIILHLQFRTENLIALQYIHTPFLFGKAL